MKSKYNIPILYYHSIADHLEPHKWNFLSVSIKVFKKQMEYLYKKGYSTCDWNELYNHIQGIKRLPKKTVMFHFDDGFLDNWTVVFPIMKKLNFKYSIVVTPEFIQDGEIREMLTKTTEQNKENWWGYINRKEIKAMSDSGLVDIQAHGYTHTWYNISDKIIDIYDGTNFYPHLTWNKNPEKKPYWLNNDFNVPKGYPIFEHKKSLEVEKQFIVNNKFINTLIQKFDNQKSKNENLEQYNKIFSFYKKNDELGRYETEKESNERLMKELKTTRKFISEITKKSVDYLVFPGGGNSDKVIEYAKKSGYKLISKGTKFNTFGSKNYQVERYSGTYTFPKIFNTSLNLFFLKLQIARSNGNFLVNQIFNLIRK